LHLISSCKIWFFNRNFWLWWLCVCYTVQ